MKGVAILYLIAATVADDSLELLQAHHRPVISTSSSQSSCSVKKNRWRDSICKAKLRIAKNLHVDICAVRPFKRKCAQTCCLEEIEDKCEDFQWPPSPFCKVDADCDEGDECTGLAPRSCRCDAKTGQPKKCSKANKKICQPKPDLCEDFQWPPAGVDVCKSDKDCVEGEVCGGCSPSKCQCDPDTGGPGLCTKDCQGRCEPKCEDFEWPPPGTEFCSGDKDCGTDEVCEATCTPSSCTCNPYGPNICTEDCRNTCVPKPDPCEDFVWPPLGTQFCSSDKECGRDEECKDTCTPSVCTCDDICSRDCQKTCEKKEDKCEDFVWPPTGTVFCSSDKECGADEECTGCTASSCSCDEETGDRGICTADCRTTCKPVDSCIKNPNLICLQVLTCIDGQQYPSSCGPDNCEEPLGPCEPGCSAQTQSEGCFIPACAAPPPGCTAELQYAADSDGKCCPTGCTYNPPGCLSGPILSPPAPPEEEEPCDPNLICTQALTCFGGQQYPTGCGPSNCDAPLGPCGPSITLSSNL